MIRVAVMYPNSRDKKFDITYYKDQHMALVAKNYSEFGLLSLEVDIAKVKEGAQSAPYIAIGYMMFESTKSFMQAYQAKGKEVMADIINFTDIEPEVQISEHTKL